MKRELCEKEKIRLEDEIMGYRDTGIKEKRRTVGNISEEMGASGPSRVDTLYEMGKNQLREKQQQQPGDELPKECTFHPNITKNSKESAKNLDRDNTSKNLSRDSSAFMSEDNPVSHRSLRGQTVRNEIRDYDKSVFRMYEARRLRDDSQSREKGLTNRKNEDESFYRREDDSPLVYLNVSMEGY